MKARVLRTNQIIEVEYLGKLGKFSKIFRDIQSGIEYTEKDIVFCFDFNSSVCTDRHQSERLLALGLRKETADMAWLRGHEKPVVLSNPFNDKEYGCIPAWSLHRLIDLAYGNWKEGTAPICLGNSYDMLIGRIEFQVKHGKFNKGYLV